MAINYFIGWSLEDLESELRSAQEDLALGKQVIRAYAGETRADNEVEKSAEARIQLLYKALNAKDPRKYPIDQINATTATKAAFG